MKGALVLLVVAIVQGSFCLPFPQVDEQPSSEQPADPDANPPTSNEIKATAAAMIASGIDTAIAGIKLGQLAGAEVNQIGQSVTNRTQQTINQVMEVGKPVRDAVLNAVHSAMQAFGAVASIPLAVARPYIDTTTQLINNTLHLGNDVAKIPGPLGTQLVQTGINATAQGINAIADAFQQVANSTKEATGRHI